MESLYWAADPTGAIHVQHRGDLGCVSVDDGHRVVGLRRVDIRRLALVAAGGDALDSRHARPNANVLGGEGRRVLLVHLRGRRQHVLGEPLGVDERVEAVERELDGFDPGWRGQTLRLIRHQQQVASTGSRAAVRTVGLRSLFCCRRPGRHC